MATFASSNTESYSSDDNKNTGLDTHTESNTISPFPSLNVNLDTPSDPFLMQLPSQTVSNTSTPSTSSPLHSAVAGDTSQGGFDVMAQLASQYYSVPTTRDRSVSAPLRPTGGLGTSRWNFAEESNSNMSTVLGSNLPLSPLPLTIHPTDTIAPVVDSGITPGAIGSGPRSTNGTFSPVEQPENEPAHVAGAKDQSMPDVLPATFLRTICDQLEYYFKDENILSDVFLLKNMNAEGYVKLELLASFGRIKKLTTDLEQIRKSLELSTKLLLNEDQTMVCRKDPLSPEHTYHGMLARTAIAYNLPEDASIASLRETFETCGQISYIRLLKKNATTGRNAVLKPPIAPGETYAIVEFTDDEMTKHAVLTLSDQYNLETGMQVVLFDGTNCEKLKQRMFPDASAGETGRRGDRGRAKSTSAVPRPVHVEAVGEGLEDLREGKVNTGTVYSIRGAGGLITPTRQDTACISFRLIPDEDGNIDIKQGDYVSFTVGKNKKSGRKYASKVKLEYRPPAELTMDMSSLSVNSSNGKDYFSSSPNRWESRSRSATVGAPSTTPTFRGRSNSGSRPKLNLSSPRLASSPPNSGNNMMNSAYRQALGPDGTRGFGVRRDPETSANQKVSPPTERRRARSSASALYGS